MIELPFFRIGRSHRNNRQGLTAKPLEDDDKNEAPIKLTYRHQTRFPYWKDRSGFEEGYVQDRKIQAVLCKVSVSFGVIPYDFHIILYLQNNMMSNSCMPLIDCHRQCRILHFMHFG
jgi:hypothetical protein